jgi:hypothetical protein
MGESSEVRMRAQEDERATVARIDALEAQLVEERRHLEEVRVFQAMLAAYDGGEPAPARSEWEPAVTVEPPVEMATALSEAQAEELDRLNRLFGLGHGDDHTS